ncbi:hypothetical protein [Nocardia callitridis]|uniref:PE domain-containing protein n=1 Tax=Nocardia callitridis TaxID=648753 RepID=A0ABP9K817_9NOCA
MSDTTITATATPVLPMIGASHPWSTDQAENAAVDEIGATVSAMAELLHAFDSARYIDPSGGYLVA